MTAKKEKKGLISGALSTVFNKKNFVRALILTSVFMAGNLTKRPTDKALKSAGKFIVKTYKSTTNSLEKTFPSLK